MTVISWMMIKVRITWGDKKWKNKNGRKRTLHAGCTTNAEMRRLMGDHYRSGSNHLITSISVFLSYCLTQLYADDSYAHLKHTQVPLFLLIFIFFNVCWFMSAFICHSIGLYLSGQRCRVKNTYTGIIVMLMTIVFYYYCYVMIIIVIDVYFWILLNMYYYYFLFSLYFTWSRKGELWKWNTQYWGSSWLYRTHLYSRMTCLCRNVEVCIHHNQRKLWW